MPSICLFPSFLAWRHGRFTRYIWRRTLFDDPLVAVRFDRFVNGEERWLAVGKALQVHVLVVIHTYRIDADQEVIRIISARRATSHERRLYEEE